MPRATPIAASLLCLASGTAAAGVFDELEPETEWTLFSPAPRSALRPVAERTSATTVDAGHAQLDVDVVNAAWEGSGGDSRFDVLALKARVGLTRRFDAQLELTPYRQTYTAEGPRMGTARGVSDTTLRVGLNLWGNDGGISAASLVPFIRIPTATGGVGTGALEGGVTAPISIALPAHLQGWLVASAEFADNVIGGRGVHPRLGVRVGLERHVAGPVALRVDWQTIADAEGGTVTNHHEIEADGALAIGRDLVVRIGGAVAVLGHAEVSPYVRVSMRR